MKKTMLILLALGAFIMVGSVIWTLYQPQIPDFDGGYR